MSGRTEDDGVKVDMESSVYSQVVFIDVPHSYPLHTDVICCYKLTEGLIPSSKDWIGIYKVGWNSVQKYICYEYVNPSLDFKDLDCIKHQIVFKEHYLPKDDELYQFCYVDSTGKVRGASTAFCFQKPAETSMDHNLLVISEQDERINRIENDLLNRSMHIEKAVKETGAAVVSLKARRKKIWIAVCTGILVLILVISLAISFRGV